MTHIIYAVKIDSNTKKELSRIEVGTAIIDAYGRISANKFNTLKNKALNEIKCCNNQSIIICTDDKRVADFGGYPAETFVKFESQDGSVNLISTTEYAKAHGLDASTVKQKAERGLLKTAIKIGRNWAISPDEPWIDNRKKEQIEVYEVGLSNDSCLFDSITKKMTAREALEWALGRNENYVAQFYHTTSPRAGISLSINYDDISYYNFGGEWVDLTFEEAVKMIEEH